MWNKIKNSKWLYVLLSILMAVILWAYVVKEADPDLTKDVAGIPVTFTGTGILNSRNLIVTEGGEQSLTLNISAKSATLNKLSRDTISLTVDLSNIVEPGTFRRIVNVSYPQNVNQGDISLNTELDGLYIEFTVSKKETKEVPVYVEFSGSIAKGYQAGEATITPGTISVSGQRELVNQVASAKVVLTQQELSETYEGDLTFVFVGSDGEELTDANIQSNVDTVHVIYPIVQYKQIPLVVELVPGGGATPDDVTVLPLLEGAEPLEDQPDGARQVVVGEISITGPEDELDGLHKLVVGQVDLADVITSKTYTFPITLSEGFGNESGIQELSVSVAIKEGALARREFAVTNIVLVNKPEGLNVELVTQSRQVTIRGTQEAVNRIYEGQLRIVADVAASNATAVGRHNIPAKVYVDGSDDVGVVGGDYNITIDITQ